MLQRAASNAYSWWWASNIRSSQSKWLDSNLQEMEEKVKYMLKIIDEDADSFAKRAEMYYKKRPELMNFVEDTFKAYKALAERYDRISGELHKANHTIATAFPDQIQFSIEDDDDNDGLPRAITSIDSSKKIHKSHVEINENRHEKPVDKNTKNLRVTTAQISKDKAQEEIDRLQKEILVLQTQKEFIKSSYESGVAKFWEIEKQIGEMQEEVCFLQDHFSASSVIDDDEARALMAAAAIKSCEDTLVNLQEQQKRSIEEARIESERIKNADARLRALKGETEDHNSAEITSMEEQVSVLKPERIELQLLCDRVKEHFEMNSEASVVELAGKIDELADKVIGLELTVSSQNAEIRKLRSETDEIQKQLQCLEVEKVTLVDDSNGFIERLKQAEEALQRIKELEKCVKDAKNVLSLHFAEVCRNLNGLSEKLHNPEHQELKFAEIHNAEDSSSQATDKDVKCSENTEKLNGNDDKINDKASSQAEDRIQLNEEQDDTEDALLNLQLLLTKGLEDREKVLLAEYTSILRNYKDIKKKLSEVEKKNQDSHSEIIVQLRELKSSNAMKDEEIRLLRQNLILMQNCSNESKDATLANGGNPFLSKLESMSNFSKFRSQSSKRDCEMTLDANAADTANLNKEGINSCGIGEPPAVSEIEEKFRRDIDCVLEENLEFWLRFSTTFHRVQTLQTTFDGLVAETVKLKNTKTQPETSEGSSADRSQKSGSEPPMANRLRELKTELQVWLEQNAMLKGELKQRFSSLCEIQDEISRVLKESSEGGDVQFTQYQAAKFQGEVLNMQQENNKVSEELQAGQDHVRGLQVEIEKVLSKLQEKLELSGSRSNHHSHPFRHLSSKAKIPLRSFLYGVKPKKPSMFACVSPALQKQYSDMQAGLPT